jgi:hypothetical protein
LKVHDPHTWPVTAAVRPRQISARTATAANCTFASGGGRGASAAHFDLDVIRALPAGIASGWLNRPEPADADARFSAHRSAGVHCELNPHS